MEGENGDIDALLQSIRTWNLKRNVENSKNEKEYQTSTYMLARQEAYDILNACKSIGQQFVIPKQPVRGNRL